MGSYALSAGTDYFAALSTAIVAGTVFIRLQRSIFRWFGMGS